MSRWRERELTSNTVPSELHGAEQLPLRSLPAELPPPVSSFSPLTQITPAPIFLPHTTSSPRRAVVATRRPRLSLYIAPRVTCTTSVGLRTNTPCRCTTMTTFHNPLRTCPHRVLPKLIQRFLSTPDTIPIHNSPNNTWPPITFFQQTYPLPPLRVPTLLAPLRLKACPIPMPMPMVNGFHPQLSRAEIPTEKRSRLTTVPQAHPPKRTARNQSQPEGPAPVWYVGA